MKKLFVFVCVAVFLFGGNAAQAQVSESPEWASRIKAEGLNRSQVEEIAQFLTDYAGSRLTASRQKRRADSLVVTKLQEFGFSNPRAAFAMDFPRGGWDVVKTYAAMVTPYYCAFSVNPRAWSGSTDGLVKGECMLFDVNTKEDLEKYRGKVAGKILLIPSTRTYDINFEPLASRYTEEELQVLLQDNRGTARSRYSRMNMDYRAYMELRQLINEFYAAEKPLCVVNASWNSSTISAMSGKSTISMRRFPAPIPNSRMRSSCWVATSIPGTVEPVRQTTPPAAS